MLDDLEYPQAPAYCAEWAPLFFEPISGSGEKITIGVIIRDANGTCVRRIISDGAVRRIFGRQRAHVHEMIDFVIAHVSQQGHPDTPQFPLTGFNLGDWKQASSAGERTGILKQVAYRSLFSVSFDEVNGEEDEELRTPQWANSIKKIVVEERPELADAFNVSVQISPYTLPTKVSFLHRKKAVQVGTLRFPDISASVRTAKGKGWDLVSLRRNNLASDVMLLLGVHTTGGWSSNAFGPSIDELAVSEIQRMANEENIKLKMVKTIEEAATQLLEIAA